MPTCIRYMATFGYIWLQYGTVAISLDLFVHQAKVQLEKMSACEFVFALVRLVPGIILYLGPNVQKRVEEEAVKCISCFGRYIRREDALPAIVAQETTRSGETGGCKNEPRDVTAVTTVQPDSPNVSIGPVQTESAVFQPVKMMDRDLDLVAISVEMTLCEEALKRGVKFDISVKSGSVVLILRYPTTLSEKISSDINTYVVPRAMQLFYENGVFDKAWFIGWHVETDATAINEFLFEVTKKEHPCADEIGTFTTFKEVEVRTETTKTVSEVVTTKNVKKSYSEVVQNPWTVDKNTSLPGIDRIFPDGYTFALKSYHGTYLCAMDGSDNARVGMVAHIEYGAIWTFVSVRKDVYGMRSSYGTYLHAYPGGENATVDLAPHLKDHEYWTVISPRPGKFAFRSAHLNYLRAHKGLGRADQQVDARDWKIMTWEQFELVLIRKV